MVESEGLFRIENMKVVIYLVFYEIEDNWKRVYMIGKFIRVFLKLLIFCYFGY